MLGVPAATATAVPASNLCAGGNTSAVVRIEKTDNSEKQFKSLSLSTINIFSLAQRFEIETAIIVAIGIPRISFYDSSTPPLLEFSAFNEI